MLLPGPCRLLLIALLAAPALGQGGDDCAAPQPIAGTGLFPFDNAQATAGADAGCAMGHDVWFEWTAAVSGAITVSTCGWTGVDTALAVYATAGCPLGSPLACQDDVCGLQAELVFQATAGQHYLLRLGTWVNAPNGGTGFLEISDGGSLGGCPNASSGANVIGGDLDEVITWGAVGGVSAYSFATTACNMGDTELVWVSHSDQHPVVGHNLYRFEGGRFEQLGMGWLKHGMAALQRDLCCQCAPSASISALGVGCSDPYSAYLNGQQITLGPRVEVDAFHGTFAWPIGSAVTVPPPATLVDRRVQVPTAAMDPAAHPNAVYLAESVYASPDDAAAGNHFDNASHRPYRRTGALSQGAHVLEPVGATERALPAIASWARLSPTALVREVRVPGEGAFWVGSDAIQVAPGTWRYELAVFNLNSHRAASGLVVPGGVAPRLAGMTFPRAHSGDPRRNDPWPAVVQGGRVGWGAPQAGVDPDANGILWGTTYSFWFTSDAPPVDGAGELLLLRGAGPASVAVPLRVPRDPAAPVTALECEAVPNSAGTPGLLLPGVYDGAAGTLGLRAVGLPVGAIGMVVCSRDAGFVPLAGGSTGNLCLGGTIGRSVGVFTAAANGAGELNVTADLGDLPQGNGAVAVAPGETWHFQAWHRDVPATSNFTSALRVTF